MYFETTDIVLAAYLHTTNVSLTDLTVSGRQGVFVFDIINMDIVDAFYIGKTTVEPVAFNNSIRQLTTSVRRKITT